MRKYLKVSLITGETVEITESDFDDEISTTLTVEDVIENDNFISYKFQEYVLINDKIAEYDE